MSEHTSISTEASMPYIVLFESPTGSLHATQLTFAKDDHPEKLATDIASAYQQHVRRFKRIFYRGILLKKPVVSIVKLSGVTDLSLIPDTAHQLFLEKKVHDSTLSSAIRKPAVLRRVDRDAFCREYSNVFHETEDASSRFAILVHHVHNPTASKVVGITWSIISIGLGLFGAVERFDEG